jgi:hypothetical protein
MHFEAYQDVLVIITYGLAVLVLSLVADRKHRNPLVWGLIGGLFFPCSLIYLVFLPRLCPNCRDECKGRTCPNCGTGLDRVVHYPAGRPLLNAA